MTTDPAVHAFDRKHMERQIRNNQVIMIILLLISLGSSWLLVSYLVGQVSKTADEEALAHILENSEQLHYSFTNRISDVWAIMQVENLTLSMRACPGRTGGTPSWPRRTRRPDCLPPPRRRMCASRSICCRRNPTPTGST